jgi:hypothetical protein
VPFFGAGVSRAGGAPSWEQLIQELDREGKLEEARATGLDLLAQAQIVANSYVSDEAFTNAIVERLRVAPVSLQHLLLAALGAKDAVTTNFDDAYERAVADAGRGPVAVVPQQAPHARLLKLHGSLPQGPTRESDATTTVDDPARRSLRPILTQDQFLEHERHSGPLRGALQMMLLTGHVLFIGYSLRDAGLHAAVHEVRRIRELAGVAADEPLATALQIAPSRQLSYLWSPTIDVLWPATMTTVDGVDGESRASPLRSRELEMLLDALADAAAVRAVPVLAFAREQLEPGRETQLRDRLASLVEHFGDDPPPHVREFLEAYGWPGPRSGPADEDHP